MIRSEPSFTLGIEEEYLLVDLESRDVAIDPPAEIFSECESQAEGSLVEHELLRSQIEVDTKVCRTVAEARKDLAKLRGLTSDIARRHGLAPIASSTHPFADWHMQRRTDCQRFRKIASDMRSLSRRNLVCGMHVHVGIENDELRVILMNQFVHYLPLLLALSTSSPFWQGYNTGLKCYRLTVFDGFPRTGLPDSFKDYGDYIHNIETLTRAGVISDATFIWWDLRISARYPTLECRISDMCTRLDDAASIAALIQSILHYLYRMHRRGVRQPVYPRFMADQNRWLGMRYGCEGGLLNYDSARLVPVAELLAEVVGKVREDADQLGCLRELEHALLIPSRGTSADRQIGHYERALEQGQTSGEAFSSLVDMLIAETVRDL